MQFRRISAQIVRKVGLLIGVFWFSCFFLCTQTFAHPHVFVDNRLCFVFDERGLAGVEVTWHFDEMFSAGIIMDYDKNNDGKFDAKEVQNIKHDVFDNLKNYHYFVRIFINGKEFEVRFITGFNAGISSGALVYSFMVPCHVTAAASEKEIKVLVYDEEFYTSIDTPEGNACTENAAGFNCSITYGRNTSMAYYFGMVYPDEVTLCFSRKTS